MSLVQRGTVFVLSTSAAKRRGSIIGLLHVERGRASPREIGCVSELSQLVRINAFEVNH
jgi:hypothetical protein